LQALLPDDLDLCPSYPLPTSFHEPWPLTRKIDDLRASPFRDHNL
jgi:hypothetical protein